MPIYIKESKKMQLAFSKEELAVHFPKIDSERINKVWTALQIINELDGDRWDRWAEYNLPPEKYNYTTRRLEPVLEYCDYLLETHGVEAIEKEGAYTSRYWLDTIALYLNSGDVYSPTIIADIEESEFILTTFGDFVEQQAGV